MNIYLNVEVSARELDGKLLLATLAAAKGHDARTSSPMSGVIRAFPQVFDLDVATELTTRIRFLSEEVGIPSDDVPSVIQSFPLVLGLDVTTRMRPVIEYVVACMLSLSLVVVA